MPLGVKQQFWKIDKSEQDLLEELINESIQIYGIDSYYISRTFNNLDKVYGADDSSSYSNAWLFSVYIKNVLGFSGDREFLSKFAGLEIRDQIIVSVPRYNFDQLIASDTNFPPLPNGAASPANRPREGDLIFFPDNDKCFQIKYVNLTDMFWMLGKIYTWECTCELFEYSGEQFSTGIPEIDRIQVRGDLNILNYLVLDVDNITPILLDGTGDYWVDDSFNITQLDPLQDNDAITQEANTYIDFNEQDPFADANNTGQTI